MQTDNIRNFCIIAHIDHGKSTLADRLLELTGTVSERQLREQVLDSMDLERERGITIKASAVTLDYQFDNTPYQLNLIDTPGHVDFSYEVSRALAACEGAVLLVDAAQGVEAQTVANFTLALEHGLEIVPVVNKIDLPHAQVEDTIEQMSSALAIDPDTVILASAKEGTGTEEVLRAIVERIPPPKGDDTAPLQALIFDSVYDDYRGVVSYIRVVNGTVRVGERIRLYSGSEGRANGGAGRAQEIVELGRFRPQMTKSEELNAGEVGYLCAGVKSVRDVKVGDTIVLASRPAEPLPGFKEPQPMVYCGLYPATDSDFTSLRKAIERLALNDASFLFEPETSDALGFGFRCGFLGLLHMEIVQERLERESGLSLVKTAPNVTFEVILRSGKEIVVHSPSDVPSVRPGDKGGGKQGEVAGGGVAEFREPVVRAQMVLPAEFIGPVTKLAEDRRGKHVRMEYIGAKRVILVYDLPLMEIVYDFHDRLKSVSRGYATLDYELLGYFPSDLAKVDVLVNEIRVDALSFICHRSVAARRGRAVIRRLQKEIPRHLFQIPLQAAIGGKIVARENIAPIRKNVTAKCYGGDITRKRKLLEKQKEGKKRMKAVGSVRVPQEAFLAVLGTDE